MCRGVPLGRPRAQSRALQMNSLTPYARGTPSALTLEVRECFAVGPPAPWVRVVQVLYHSTLPLPGERGLSTPVPLTGLTGSVRSLTPCVRGIGSISAFPHGTVHSRSAGVDSLLPSLR